MERPGAAITAASGDVVERMREKRFVDADRPHDADVAVSSTRWDSALRRLTAAPCRNDRAHTNWCNRPASTTTALSEENEESLPQDRIPGRLPFRACLTGCEWPRCIRLSAAPSHRSDALAGRCPRPSPTS